MTPESLYKIFQTGFSLLTPAIPYISAILVIFFIFIVIGVSGFIIYFFFKKAPYILKSVIWSLKVLKEYLLKFSKDFEARQTKEILKFYSFNSKLPIRISKVFANVLFGITISHKRKSFPLSIIIECYSTIPICKLAYDISQFPYIELVNDQYKLYISLEKLSSDYLALLFKELELVSKNSIVDDIVFLVNETHISSNVNKDIIRVISEINSKVSTSTPISFILNSNPAFTEVLFPLTNDLSQGNDHLIFSISNINKSSTYTESKLWIDDIATRVVSKLGLSKPADIDKVFEQFMIGYYHIRRDFLSFTEEICNSSVFKKDDDSCIFLNGLALHISKPDSLSNVINLIESLSHSGRSKSYFTSSSNSLNNKSTNKLNYFLGFAVFMFAVGSFKSFTTSQNHFRRINTEILNSEFIRNVQYPGIEYLPQIILQKEYLDAYDPTYLFIPHSWNSQSHRFLSEFITYHMAAHSRTALIAQNDKWLSSNESRDSIVTTEKEFNNAMSELQRLALLRGLLQSIAERKEESDISYLQFWSLIYDNPNNTPESKGVDGKNKIPQQILRSILELPLNEIINVFNKKVNTIVSALINYRVKQLYVNNIFKNKLHSLIGTFNRLKQGFILTSEDINSVNEFAQLFDILNLTEEGKLILGDVKVAQAQHYLFLSKLVAMNVITLDKANTLSEEFSVFHRTFHNELKSATLPGIGIIINDYSVDIPYLHTSAGFNEFRRLWNSLFSQLGIYRIDIKTSDENNNLKRALESSSDIFSPVFSYADIRDTSRNTIGFLESSLGSFDAVIRDSLGRIFRKVVRSKIETAIKSALSSTNASILPPIITNDLGPAYEGTALNNTQEISTLIQVVKLYNEFLDVNMYFSVPTKSEVTDVISQRVNQFLDNSRTDFIKLNLLSKFIEDSNRKIKFPLPESESKADYQYWLKQNFDSIVSQFSSRYSQLQPLIELLQSSKSFTVSKISSQYWNSIGEAIDQYRSSKGPFYEIETILTSLTDIDSQSDCTFPKREILDAHPLFRSAYREAKDLFTKNCKNAKLDASLRIFEDFLGEYNSSYARRFPFSQNLTAKHITRDEFLLLKKRFIEIKPHLERMSEFVGPEVQYLLRKLHVLFSTVDLDKVDSTLKFNVKVISNHSTSILPHLIELKLQVGEKLYDLRSGSQSINWILGDPFSFTIRIALNSPYVFNTSSPNKPLYSVSTEKTLSFKFTDLWSFPMFIRLFSESSTINDGGNFKITLPVALGDKTSSEIIYLSITDASGSLPIPLFNGIVPFKITDKQRTSINVN